MYVLTLDGITYMTMYVPMLVLQTHTSLLCRAGIRCINARVDVLIMNYNVHLGKLLP
jgi:hypothetical protein